MPGVARLGDICTGHDCFPPRPNIGASGNVFANGIGVHRQGDPWDFHTCTDPKTPHGTHDSVLAGGSPTVFVNGKSIGRIGDDVACGGAVATGSGNVFAG